ncbi:MAG TPA: response regulator [Candidatus Nitrosocosmicus sp.]|nr:response regulator [Candidatus Nitrosocosmicus sp.]
MGNNIIVIDDDIGTALFFKICLEDEGYQVNIYNDPNSLLEEFEPGIYDLLITDIRMPRINGFELASRIRIMDSKIKICLATAFEEYYESIIKTYSDLSFNCIIRKPINKDKFLEIIKNRLSESSYR